VRLASAAALVWLLVAPVRPEPTVIPWAWERREELRFAGQRAPVAWYAGIITLDGARVHVEPRRNPLTLAKNAHRIAVIRIETRDAKLDARQLEETLRAIRRLFRNAEELQIDFDALQSERAFYRALLHGVRRQTDARLSITALTSWCFDDRWLGGLPVDEAVPMFFRMGRDDRAMRARLARGAAIPEPLCRASAGISLDEPLPRIPRVARVWIFNPQPWTEESWKLAQSRAR
jgi:hypothetical protein